MKATVLIDNITNSELLPEWGLSIYIEYEDKKILLDTGASEQFAVNAQALQIDLADVEYGVLSHAHYDHADGMDCFFEKNKAANFYLREGSAENCYKRKFLSKKYIGIKKGILQKYENRIVYAQGAYELCPEVVLLPHSTQGLAAIGKKNHMYIRNRGWKLDDFAHEQSLIFDTPKGLVIFNSCCHAGADTVIKEAADAFPDKAIYAIIGGFHLHNRTEEEVRQMADGIRKTGVQKVYTGHCTGEKAFEILKEELGDMAEQLYVGMVIEL